jgi:hypothetical protein
MQVPACCGPIPGCSLHSCCQQCRLCLWMLQSGHTSRVGGLPGPCLLPDPDKPLFNVAWMNVLSEGVPSQHMGMRMLLCVVPLQAFLAAAAWLCQKPSWPWLLGLWDECVGLLTQMASLLAELSAACVKWGCRAGVLPSTPSVVPCMPALQRSGSGCSGCQPHMFI